MTMPLIIIFEGPDRCGKTTTRKEFERITKYSHICVDRQFASVLAYDHIRNMEISKWDMNLAVFAKHISRSPMHHVILKFTPDQYLVNTLAFKTDHVPVKVDEQNKAFDCACKELLKACKTNLTVIEVKPELSTFANPQKVLARQIKNKIENLLGRQI